MSDTKTREWSEVAMLCDREMVCGECYVREWERQREERRGGEREGGERKGGRGGKGRENKREEKERKREEEKREGEREERVSLRSRLTVISTWLSPRGISMTPESPNSPARVT